MRAPTGSVVVTGVSSGIGAATARVLARNGFHVFGTVRKQADAEALKAELGDKFSPLVCDVTDEPSVIAAAEQAAAQLAGEPLSGLVNNAGVALGGPLLYLPTDTFRRQLEVNLTGVLIATKAFAPLLGARKDFDGRPGRILNMGSVGGRHAFPFMGPYHTSKFGLEGFNESLRREMMPFGVEVILIAPGSVETPIWEKTKDQPDEEFMDTPYAGTLTVFRKMLLATGRHGIPAERVGETVLKALSAKKPRTYYRVTNAPMQFHLLTKMPARLVDKVIMNRLKPRPGSPEAELGQSGQPARTNKKA